MDGRMDGWMDRMDEWMGWMDGWMFFKIIVPRLHVPAGAFFLRKKTFPEKMYFLKNQKKKRFL